MAFVPGNTRLIKILPDLYAKIEYDNPFGSAKDRSVFGMLRRIPADKIFEISSGNTGVALAGYGTAMEKRVRIYVKDGTGKGKILLMKMLGAEVISVPPEKYYSKAWRDTLRKSLEDKEWAFLNQHNNKDNREAMRTMAREIMEDLGQEPEYIITGIGTGGTAAGAILETKMTKVIGTYGDIEGTMQDPTFWGQLNGERERLSTVRVTKEDSEAGVRWLLRHGIRGGYSSGENVAAWKRLKPKGTTVIIIHDSIERYG